jgi:hypothetical protein
VARAKADCIASYGQAIQAESGEGGVFWPM